MFSGKKDRAADVLVWRDIRNEVAAVNPELASILDEIDPSDEYKLVKANYRYGDLVVKTGQAQIAAQDGHLAPTTSDKINTRVRKLLSYSPIPLFLTLQNDNEVFIDTGSRVIPLNLFHQGSILGLFESIDFLYGLKSTPVWSVSAGSRTILLLPKIADAIGLKRLRAHYDLPSTIRLQGMADHWAVFKSIATHPDFEQGWSNWVLFFTEKWLNKDLSPGWSKFRNFLFQRGWSQAKFAMGKIELGLAWESFVEAISLRNLKPRPYLIDQVRHVLSISVGRSPGFRPMDNLQQAAPTKGIQKALTEIYGLKQYLPTLIHMGSLDCIQQRVPIYYSLAFPTLIEGSPLNRSSSTVMVDLRDLKVLIDTLTSYSMAKKENDQPRFNEVYFDYFHVEHDNSGDIRSSEYLSKEDACFLVDKPLFRGRDFCVTSPFWRGCIRIKAL